MELNGKCSSRAWYQLPVYACVRQLRVSTVPFIILVKISVASLAVRHLQEMFVSLLERKI